MFSIVDWIKDLGLFEHQKRKYDEDITKMITPATKSANTFHLFPLLPPEIRCLIWHFAALSHPARVIYLEFSASETLHGQKRGYTSSASIPAVLHTCQDSRNEALRARYQLEFATTSADPAPARIYVDFNSDVIHLRRFVPQEHHENMYSPSFPLIQAAIVPMLWLETFSGWERNVHVWRYRQDHTYEIPIEAYGGTLRSLNELCILGSGVDEERDLRNIDLEYSEGETSSWAKVQPHLSKPLHEMLGWQYGVRPMIAWANPSQGPKTARRRRRHRIYPD
ncbi:hypothetical protein G7Y89_g5631 [Cudoniella acicularis]|uniref:2EXR domain-containing protein n=1 Tax=Cudoniella acicularis TaxID=354080 RepID=A0A8H4RM33_9HELO|nr:hypothetical protein G7Y89_g5631 [Cudoniella acicularis]